MPRNSSSKTRRVVYRNARWGASIGAYEGLKGAVLSTPLLIASAAIAPDENTATNVTAYVIVAIGFLIPFVRLVTGGVWVCGDALIARNSFRTIAVSIRDIDSVVPVYLWQGFFSVVGVLGKTQGVTLLAVPATDIAALERALARFRLE